MKMPKIILCFCLSIVIASTALAGAHAVKQPETIPIVTIKQILNSPRYINANITVTGVFKGWGSKTMSPPPVTKSDYIIEDHGTEIYVTGPMPIGLTIKDIGKTITIKAKVKSTVLKMAGKTWKITYLEVL